jgi:hypothetical protein
MSKRTSVYLTDDLEAAVKATGASLGQLLRRGVAAASSELVTLTEAAELLGTDEQGIRRLAAEGWLEVRRVPAQVVITRASVTQAADRPMPPYPPAALQCRDRKRSAEIRAWAEGQGYRLAPRGRIPGAVVAAYVAAQRTLEALN